MRFWRTTTQSGKGLTLADPDSAGTPTRCSLSAACYPPSSRAAPKVLLRVKSFLGIKGGFCIETAEGLAFSRGDVLFQLGRHLSRNIRVLVSHVRQFFRVFLKVVKLRLIDAERSVRKFVKLSLECLGRPNLAIAPFLVTYRPDPAIGLYHTIVYPAGHAGYQGPEIVSSYPRRWRQCQ